MGLDIPDDAAGVLPCQAIQMAIKNRWVFSEHDDIAPENIQPASLDLRLGSVAHRLRCSFLPDDLPVEKKLKRYSMDSFNLGGGAILEQNRPYLIPLVECLALPENIRAKANPKSSTGRLDVFTRVITDNSFMFDEITAGYTGRLYLEIVPRTFTIRVRPGLALNQLRLIAGEECTLPDAEILELHRKQPLLYRDGRPLALDEVAVNSGLFLGLHLSRGLRTGRDTSRALVGYQAKDNSKVIDLSKTDNYRVPEFWEEVYSEAEDLIVLNPEKFYLLLSQDSVCIPPEYAGEMIAYDPTSGELRTHYAGFFDPGFGCDPRTGLLLGSRAALEVRAHDVPFAIEHGQKICKLSFERMLAPPERVYGHDLDSNYQGQTVALSKHFKREQPRTAGQASLFG